MSPHNSVGSCWDSTSFDIVSNPQRKCRPGVSLPADDQLVLLGTWEEGQLAGIVGNGSGGGDGSPDFFQDQGHGESMREAVRCETPSSSWGSFCPSTHSGIQAGLLCLFGYPASLLTTCPWRHFLSSGYQDPGSSAGFSSWTGNALQSQQTLCLGRENGPQTHPGCLWTVRLHSSVAMCVCTPQDTGIPFQQNQ